MNTCRLYSDFNCPFCYAMHERLHALGVMDRISWQGVQHAPHLPVPMAGWAGHLAAELKQEVQMVRRLAPELPIAVPPGKPNTGRAIAAAAMRRCYSGRPNVRGLPPRRLSAQRPPP